MTGGFSTNIGAAFDLLRNEEQGLERLDVSADGFWDSFKGLILAGLIDAVTLVPTYSARQPSEGPPIESVFGFTVAALAIALIAYLVSMVALYFLCRYFDCEGRFTTAFIANNWAAPVFSLGFLPVSLLLLAMSDGSQQSGMFVLLIAMVALVFFGIRLLRISLDVPLSKAMMLFGGSTFASLLINDLLRSVFGV